MVLVTSILGSLLRMGLEVKDTNWSNYLFLRLLLKYRPQGSTSQCQLPWLHWAPHPHPFHLQWWSLQHFKPDFPCVQKKVEQNDPLRVPSTVNWWILLNLKNIQCTHIPIIKRGDLWAIIKLRGLPFQALQLYWSTPLVGIIENWLNHLDILLITLTKNVNSP